MNITERISGLLSQIECMSAANAEELEALRIKYLSKKGEIASLFSEFRDVPNEQKKELGAQLNALCKHRARETFAVAAFDLDEIVEWSRPLHRIRSRE